MEIAASARFYLNILFVSDFVLRQLAEDPRTCVPKSVARVARQGFRAYLDILPHKSWKSAE